MSDDLDEKLKFWTVKVDAPARFRADVWQRIAAREAQQSVSWPFATFARWPGFAAVAGFMLLCGIAVGFVEGRQRNADLLQDLQTQYITSIDPRVLSANAR
jgi:hypothetical protein